MPIFLILIISLIASACSPRLVSLPDPTRIPPTVDIQATEVGTATAETDEIVSIAITDLTSRLSIDPQQVHLISAEPHLWPDAALGCPRPGEVYTQQMVPGLRLRLEANGVEYVYHTDAIDTVILCPEEELPSFPVTPGEIDDGEPWMPVD